MRIRISSLICASAAMLCLASPVPAQQRDIVDTAAAAGTFTTLTRALEAAGLVSTLKGSGPFTVFAPTDQAFERLPKGTLEKLLAPENREQLRHILTYHVVAGSVASSTARTLGSAKTLNGETLRIAVRDGSLSINDARVVTPDVKASNGVIHVIDAVLLPPEK